MKRVILTLNKINIYILRKIEDQHVLTFLNKVELILIEIMAINGKAMTREVVEICAVIIIKEVTLFQSQKLKQLNDF